MLLPMNDRSGLVLPGVERITNTAAALPAELIPRLRRLFPNALIFKMYGLTECKRVSFLEPEELEEHAASVGRAIPGTEAFVLTEDGRRAAPGEVGVLHVRGRHVMRGYWNRPDLTSAMLRPGPVPGERLLCTNDLFRMDDAGYLYFVGRSDEILKVKGEKVSPVEVENVLLAIEGVQEAAVVGIPDELLGQALCAYVRLEAGASPTERDIRRACAARLEPFMVPALVVFVTELPKTPSGKIARKALAAAVRE
jgi:acyl-coenzyme A synthetase/AMP-(fatty) acid ligase